MNFMPRMVAREAHSKTEDRRKAAGEGRGQRDQWGGMSHPENPAGGVSPSRLSGVHRAEQTPSGQLECSGAGGGGVQGSPALRGRGGWVMAER